MTTPNCAQDTQVEAPDIFIVSHQLKTTLKTYPMTGNNYKWTLPNCKEQCLWTQKYFSHEKKLADHKIICNPRKLLCSRNTWLVPKRKLGRVKFRKDVWDFYKGQEKIGQ